MSTMLLTSEPSTRAEMLEALGHQAEHRRTLLASGAPAGAVARAGERIDELLDLLGLADA